MQKAEENINDGTYIIDLDRDKITSKQKTSVVLSSTGRFRTNQKGGGSSDDLPELPEHYAKKLSKQVKDIVKPKRKKRERLSLEDVEKIRMSFLGFFVGVFQDYEKYLQQPQGGGPFVKTVEGVNACFSFQRYKEETVNDQKQFLKHFLHMQMFTRFLERKLWAQKNEDVIDITFFDEHVRLKQARNRKTFKTVSAYNY